MHCKCGKIIEPAYQLAGQCEDCFSDTSGSLIADKNDLDKPIKEKDLLSLPIAELGASERIVDLLSGANIIFVRDLTARSENDLLAMHGLGVKTVITAKTLLDQIGMHLKPNPPRREKSRA